MKCCYTSANGRLSFEVEADTQKAIFQKVAELQEVFEADQSCGCCKSENIRFRVRQAENQAKVMCSYYEMHCLDCNARLCFGQHQTGGTLFVKRRDKDGNLLAHRGWSVYQGTDTQHDDAPGGHAGNNGHAGPKTPNPSTNGSAGTTKASTGTTKQTPPDENDPHARTLSGLKAAEDKKNADDWLAWGATKLRTAAQKAEQEKAHKEALDRISLKKGKGVPF